MFNFNHLNQCFLQVCLEWLLPLGLLELALDTQTDKQKHTDTQ